MTVDSVELERLPARIGEPTPAGTLAPNVGSGALVLEGERADGAEFPFGANIAAAIIFDLDADRTVGVVETIMRLEHWERTDDDLTPPSKARRGSLKIDGSAVELYVPDAEPRFLVNGDQGRLLIEILPPGPGTEWARLSDRVHAFVDAGHLAGFAIDLNSSVR